MTTTDNAAAPVTEVTGKTTPAATTETVPTMEDRLAAAEARASKAETSYAEHRKLESRRDQELSTLRQSNERMERLIGADGSAQLAQEQASARTAERLAVEKQSAGINAYRLSALERSYAESFESVIEYAKTNADAVAALDPDGDTDWERSLENARTHMRLRKYEAADAATEAAKAELAAKNRTLKAEAGIPGAAAAEVEEGFVITKDTHSDDILASGAVAGRGVIKPVRRTS